MFEIEELRNVISIFRNTFSFTLEFLRLRRNANPESTNIGEPSDPPTPPNGGGDDPPPEEP